MLANKEGVFAEPASAASIAGLLKLIKKGYFKNKRGNITCILTGHGLKDPDRAIKSVKEPKLVEPDMKAILKEIGY
jgi:threonine synthase